MTNRHGLTKSEMQAMANFFRDSVHQINMSAKRFSRVKKNLKRVSAKADKRTIAQAEREMEEGWKRFSIAKDILSKASVKAKKESTRRYVKKA